MPKSIAPDAIRESFNEFGLDVEELGSPIKDLGSSNDPLQVD